MNNKNNKNSPVQLSNVIDKTIRSLGLSSQYYGWQIIQNWPEIVGKVIAQKTQAKRFEDGVLFVVVSDASWRQELQMKLGDILDKIHSQPSGKVIKKIRLIGS